jgi:hypothetical protein
LCTETEENEENEENEQKKDGRKRAEEETKKPML